MRRCVPGAPHIARTLFHVLNHSSICSGSEQYGDTFAVPSSMSTWRSKVRAPLP